MILINLSLIDISLFLPPTENFYFLSTSRFSQNALENEFSQVRRRAGITPCSQEALSALKLHRSAIENCNGTESVASVSIVVLTNKANTDSSNSNCWICVWHQPLSFVWTKTLDFLGCCSHFIIRIFIWYEKHKLLGEKTGFYCTTLLIRNIKGIVLFSATFVSLELSIKLETISFENAFLKQFDRNLFDISGSTTATMIKMVCPTCVNF